jgi:hypothetical protein
VYAFNYIRNLHTISCLQNTLIVYKQTSALHIINANLFGKVFVNVRNCLRKEKHMIQTKNIDGFYTKTTQRVGYSKLCVKKNVIVGHGIYE